MIDKLIAQEREARSSAADQYVPDDESNGKRNVKCEQSGEAEALRNGANSLPKDHLFGIGPLAAPVMSSTQRSDMENGVRMTQFPQIKATSNGTSEEFQPLQPDMSPRSSVHSVNSQGEFPIIENGSTGYYGGHNTGDMVNGGQEDGQRGRVTFGAPSHIPNHMDDDQFINMYKKLTPEERKRQLLAQKDALLLEQRRLKAILTEQEALLKAKQQQLHRQQQMQRERLRFFEQTGFFPPVSSAASNAQGVATTSSTHNPVLFHPQHPTQQQHQENPLSLLDSFVPYPTPNVPNTAHPSSSAVNGHGMYSNNYPVPCSTSHGYTPYPSQGHMPHHHHHHHHNTQHHHHQQQQQQQGTGLHNGHTMYPQPHRPYPQLAPQGYDMNNAFLGGDTAMPLYEGQYAPGLISDSMENINFLERHGVDVSHVRRDHRKGQYALNCLTAYPCVIISSQQKLLY